MITLRLNSVSGMLPECFIDHWLRRDPKLFGDKQRQTELNVPFSIMAL
jgi:hypothetical protein